MTNTEHNGQEMGGESVTGGQIVELLYLEKMSEKAVELIKRRFENHSFSFLQTDPPFPLELLEDGAKIIVEITAKNTPIRGFHIDSSIEGHLYMINVKDKFENTVADVIFTMDIVEGKGKIEDVYVSFKPGAIIFRYEELMNESSDEGEAEDLG